MVTGRVTRSTIRAAVAASMPAWVVRSAKVRSRLTFSIASITFSAAPTPSAVSPWSSR